MVVILIISKLYEQELSLAGAIKQGSLIRLRPILKTVLVALFGFTPMTLVMGNGAEVQHPMTTEAT
jgi:heavy metal efflux system protein